MNMGCFIMNCPVTLLCKNPSDNQEKRMEQALLCAVIDGYTDATAQLSKFICKLYQDKDPNARLIYNTLQPLVKQQNKYYDELCDELNLI